MLGPLSVSQDAAHISSSKFNLLKASGNFTYHQV
jgi:hypothetical protein